jgi:L-lactate utilization protein LutC
MSTRDKILNQLRQQIQDVPAPGLWRSRRQFENLAARFDEALTGAKGEVRRARNMEAALEQVGVVLREIKAGSALVDSHPSLDAGLLSKRWPRVEWRVTGGNGGDDESLREFATAADIGLSLAQAALAETGTVIVSSGPGRSRLTPLLPPVHLALVPVSCLTTDLFTWTTARQGSLPSAVTLISGPSKTADIEQTMAIGVHGPKRFIVVLYED